VTYESVVAVLAAGLLAAVVAAAAQLYTVRFRRFARERWWERKADAYARIVESLTGLVYYYEIQGEVAIGKELSDERHADLAKQWRDGHLELKRATAAGLFLISPAAEAALTTMWREHDEHHRTAEDWLDEVEADYATTRTCLKAVVTAAQRDLGVDERRASWLKV
jgi:hypothetical protein